jgi:ketosteroid isomerase-like protein
MNQSTECLRRAYAACERGRYDDAIEHLRDAAELAQLAGDAATAAACAKAHRTVAQVIGRRHLVLA